MAATACCLWVLGFELVPNVHIAMHAHLAPHSHGAGAHASARAGGPRVFVHYDQPFHPHQDAAGESSAAHLRAHALGRAHSHSHSWTYADDPATDWAAHGREAGSHRYEWPTVGPLRPLPFTAHGAHSLAHRGLVMAQPDPPPTLAAPVKVGPLAPLAAQPDRPRTRRPMVMRVRGPPHCGSRLERSIT